MISSNQTIQRLTRLPPAIQPPPLALCLTALAARYYAAYRRQVKAELTAGIEGLQRPCRKTGETRRC